MPADRARSWGSSVATTASAGWMTAGSVVSGRSAWMALIRRSMTAACRTLCAWKKATMVSRRAR